MSESLGPSAHGLHPVAGGGLTWSICVARKLSSAVPSSSSWLHQGRPQGGLSGVLIPTFPAEGRLPAGGNQGEFSIIVCRTHRVYFYRYFLKVIRFLNLVQSDKMLIGKHRVNGTGDIQIWPNNQVRVVPERLQAEVTSRAPRSIRSGFSAMCSGCWTSPARFPWSIDGVMVVPASG